MSPDLAGRTPRPQHEPLSPGEYEATCLSAVRTTSAAGNACIVWTFELPDRTHVDYWTVQRRVETGLAAWALGLDRKPLPLKQAAGKRCKVTVAQDGPWHKITGVRPL